MFNALGGIFSIKPRQAENSDTRQNIQRHDPDFERPRKKKDSQSDDSFIQEGATVSVAALRLFLQNFIKNGAEEGQENPSETTAPSEKPAPDPLDFKIQTEMTLDDTNAADKKSAAAAYAASTYKSAAQTNDKSSVLIETTDTAQGPPLDLSAADIRTVYALIEDLKILSEKNIEYLHIERAESFLESLMNAVNKVKAAL